MKRFLFAIPFAVATTFLLFSFMVMLVGQSTRPPQTMTSQKAIDMFVSQPEQTVKKKTYKLPSPPVSAKVIAPPAPKQVAYKGNQGISLPITSPIVPEVPLNFSVNNMPVSVPDVRIPVKNAAEEMNITTGTSLAEFMASVPLARVEPRYPSRALQRKLEGYVILSFTIDKQGIPKDIKVIDSQPKRIFEREAKRALARWKYQPLLVNGLAKALRDQMVKIEFRIQR